MTKTRAWPVRAIYMMLLAAALVISLIITAGPASRVGAAPDVRAEWDRVATPTTEGWVLAPESTIIDYAVASEGEVAYAIVASDMHEAYFLLKSEDHAATWKDITDNLGDLGFPTLLKVATDGVDPDFVAVALYEDTAISVYVSNDGGTTFEAIGTGDMDLDKVYDLAVSPEVNDVRNVAIAGEGDVSNLYRARVTGTVGSWVNATHATNYAGWNDGDEAVVAVKFPLTWAVDATVLAVSVTGNSAHLQSGHWGTTPRWNEQAGFAPAVELVGNGVTVPYYTLGGFTAGITLPTDYEGTVVTRRESWVWVNYYGPDGPEGTIFWVSDADAIPVTQQIAGQPWLTNVSYWGNIASGKAIAGVLGDGKGEYTEPCHVVQVYRYLTVANMDICCPRWLSACKPPTGSWGMAAFYVSADKAYAVALDDWRAYDESAWSFSYDDGDTWNQVSLIDTYISWLSDVAVSPNCNKTMLVSVNYGPDEEQRPNNNMTEPMQVSERLFCDSVWYKAEVSAYAPEYSGQWLRTWSGQFQGAHPVTGDEHGMLRLAPEEENGDTVYLVDVGTDRVYWNEMQTLACWSHGTASVAEIIDLALKDAATPYALGLNGDVAMSDDFAKTHRWQAKVASGVDDGWTIAVWGDHILVGGQDRDVAYSDDGGEEFAELENVPGEGDFNFVTVAFDSYFDANDVVYAAVNEDDTSGGIYLWVIDESTRWIDLMAEDYAYTGLVLDNADGNPMTSPATGGVLYASYIGERVVGTDYYYTGVARALTPLMEVDECIECPVDWDYLVVGLTVAEEFIMAPQALKICGCLTPDSYTKLFAIGSVEEGYDMAKGRDGTVWTFEDCYSKVGAELRAPANGFLVPADPCECHAAPFTISWDRLCDACVYQIQFASDPDFTYELQTFWSSDSPADNPHQIITHPEPTLLPGQSYYWRVRAIKAGTGQEIRSWWSDARMLMVAPVAGTGVEVIAPEIGATNVARTNIAFVWGSITPVDEYDWELTNDPSFATTIATASGLTDPAYTYTGAALAYDTPYYWRVTGIQDGAPVSQALGTFRTVPEVPPEPEVPEPVTPFWVWVVIAIGAVLVIVVIVLIFRTRRV